MKHEQRSKIRVLGRGAVVLGVLLAVTGLAMSSADAGQHDGQKTKICHATSSASNPYRLIEVDLSATNGPDHSTHLGPVFDPSIHEQGDEWGDIIPEGLNWEEGRTLYDNDCQLPDEPDDPPVCEFDPDLDADDPNCVPPTDVCPDLEGVQTDPADCPELTDVCPDLEGVQTDPADCPEPVDACPTVAGIQATTAECPTVVGGIVITPAPAVTAAAELPRTGSGSSQMAMVGLGLVLMGAGALVSGREHAIA